MTKITVAFSFVAITLGVLLHATAANAQSARTWVSGVGSDSNPCTRAAPCASLATAYANTAAGGEIDVLDGGDFGPLVGIPSIYHSITIANDGTGTATISSANGGLFIMAPSTETVVLRGLNFSGASGGINSPGIWVHGGGALVIDHCTFHDFPAVPAIEFFPDGAASLRISDTLFLNSGGVTSSSPGNTASASLWITGSVSLPGAVTALLERVQIYNANSNAIRVDNSMAPAGPVDVELHDVIVDGTRSGSGIVAVSDASGGPAATIMADNVTSSHNAGYGLRAVGSTASVYLGRSTVTSNAVGIGASGGGAIFSYGDNRFAGNTGGDGVTPTPIGLK
jgi:hypothetical protein